MSSTQRHSTFSRPAPTLRLIIGRVTTGKNRERGSKAYRAAWLEVAALPGDASGHLAAPGRRPPANPFAPDANERPSNPFAPVGARRGASNPFALDADDTLDANPFAPSRSARPSVPAGGPRKLGLLGRGLAVFGSYAKVLVLEEDDGERPAAYAQFGPLSAYPRALRLRDLYSQLPDAPLPAVITCIATTADAHRRGWRCGSSRRSATTSRAGASSRSRPTPRRGPTPTRRAPRPLRSGSGRASGLPVDDERFPVVRREL